MLLLLLLLFAVYFLGDFAYKLCSGRLISPSIAKWPSLLNASRDKRPLEMLCS